MSRTTRKSGLGPAVVFGMIDVTELRRLFRVTRFDFWIAVAAVIGVLSAGVAVVRLDGGLFFATAEALENRVRALTDDDGPLQALVLDLEGVNFIDSQGASTLAELHDFLAAEGVALRLARTKPQVLTVLEADGFVARIGADHLHGNVHRAVEAHRESGALGG